MLKGHTRLREVAVLISQTTMRHTMMLSSSRQEHMYWCNMVPPKMPQNFMYDHTTDAIAYHSDSRQPLTDGGRCHCLSRHQRCRPPTSSTPARRQMDSKWNSTKKIQEENVQFHATHIVHYISLLEVDMPWLCHFFEPSLALGFGLCSCAQPPSKIVLSSLRRKAAIS